MNRQILFRGLTASNEWVEGYYVHDTEWAKHYIYRQIKVGAFFQCRPVEVNEKSIQQFTDLHDKHGKRIFEGDVLKYKSHHPKHDGKCFNNVVEFAQGQSLCGWRMRNKSTIVKATPLKFSSSEIIGNIHTNPELTQP